MNKEIDSSNGYSPYRRPIKIFVYICVLAVIFSFITTIWSIIDFNVNPTVEYYRTLGSRFYYSLSPLVGLLITAVFAGIGVILSAIFLSLRGEDLFTVLKRQHPIVETEE